MSCTYNRHSGGEDSAKSSAFMHREEVEESQKCRCCWDRLSCPSLTKSSGGSRIMLPGGGGGQHCANKLQTSPHLPAVVILSLI